ncbi:MAG: CRTAC1 family protein, partial [Bacteroidota bacterium]
MRVSCALWSFVAFVLIMLPSCASEDQQTESRFTLTSPSATGIEFRNDLVANPEQNIFNYLYFYNGGGVGMGDLNGDGLPEIYFSSNQGADKLYLNLGDMQFEDRSELLGATDGDWSTGVSFADVNADGLLDIYISVATPVSTNPNAHNRLYINESQDGELLLREAAAEFGLNQVGYGTQAAFFDFDRDGDLDCYQLNHSVHALGTFQRRSTQMGTVSELAGDRLLEKTDDGYVDVSIRANIKQMALGYGLGLSIADINSDGWPDIYVGNDFHEDDYAYINQKDGTFKDELRKMMPHTSRFTMGTDIADLNNDGRPEIMSLDMLPDDPVVLKAAAAEDPYDIWHMKQGQGYWPQFSRNNLQFNLGMPAGDSLPRFGDRGIQAGVYATDWSWSVLMEDYDQDGLRDIFISNGILGRSNDMDYINYVSEDAIQSRLKDMQVDEEDLVLANRMPVIKLPNAVFRSNGDGTFDPVYSDWGFEESTFSHGAAHGDLDGDGDLDIVVNNVNDFAGIYENQTSQLDSVEVLRVKLAGGAGNPFAYGALIEIRKDNELLFSQENQPVRGFQSSVDPGNLIIPLTAERLGASLRVVWPEGTYSELDIESGGRVSLSAADAQSGLPQVGASRRPPLGGVGYLPAHTGYSTIAAIDFGLDFTHNENLDFVDFNREALKPHMTSREGPALAQIELGGQQVIFVGGAKWQSGICYTWSESKETFESVSIPALEADARSEDVDALVLDYNGDGLEDLLVLSGGSEFPDDHEANELRFYQQNSSGTLSRDQGALPEPLRLTGGNMVALNQPDGNWQIVVAARTVLDNYGEAPPMYRIFRDNEGQLQTEQLVVDWSKLGGAGLVRDLAVAQVNQDDWPDLLIASEWGPMVLLPGSADGLRPAEVLPSRNGLWSALATSDVDGDGDIDILAGNLGMNSKLAAEVDRPVKMYYADFDGNGRREQLITYTSRLGERLFATREEIISQLPGLRQIVPDHTSFASADLQEL